MSTFVEIKNAIDKQAEAFDAFKKVNDERLKAVETGNEAKASELTDKLGKIEKDVSKFGELKSALEIEMNLNRERLEELESKSKSPTKTQAEKLKDEYKDNFIGWVRSQGKSTEHAVKMQEIQRKDVTIGSSAGGGFAVPEDIAFVITGQ